MMLEFGLPRDQVPAGFDAGAAAYDRLVGANPGYHRQLRLSARRLGLPGRGAGLRLLDAGCGTGASTAALLKVAPEAEIVAFDASAGMLQQAAAKEFPANVRFVHSTIEDLDGDSLGEFDGCLTAYLIRNLAEPDDGLATLRGLLKPGGRLALHEYSVADSRAAQMVWNLVCHTVIIPAGRVMTGDAALYEHLRRSVLQFDGIQRLRRRVAAAGFDDVRVEPMPGWQRGIAHTVVGTKAGPRP
ncbi:class I SAM-dependent methyltransferase [Kribbella sp. NPDC020789]